MKKSVLILITILVSISNSFAQKHKSDLEKLNLKGKVRILKETEYTAVQKFGELQKNEINRLIIYTFNSAGNILEKASYGKPKNLDSLILAKKEVYTYNNLGNMVEVDYFQRKKIETDIELDKKNSFVYNKNNDLSETNYFDKDGKLIGKDICKYNIKRGLIETNSYNGEGNLEFRYLYSYSPEGILAERKEYDNNIVLQHTYKYDVNGNIIAALIDQDRRTFYKYSINGNLIETTLLNNDGTLNTKKAYKYDNYRNEIEEYVTMGPAFPNAIPGKSTDLYKYDKTGNWIKKNYLSSYKELYIAERLFEYY